MTSSQTGHRALCLPVNVLRAYSAFMKATGCTGMCLLLIGILLPGQTSTTTTIPSTSAVTTTTTTTTGSAAASAPQPSATATSGATPITQSSSSTPAASSNTSSTSTTSTGPPSNSTGDGANGTTTSNSSSPSLIRCPSFACNHSDCNTMYTSHNATSCGDGAFCQLVREIDVFYVGCSASCGEGCANATHANCSVSCCNSTGCLDGAFASTVVTTTAAVTAADTTTTPATTPTTTTATTTATTATTATSITSPPTSASNGNKCHEGVCTGATCYEAFRNQPAQTCSSSEPHCQLRKETAGADLLWTAGCTTNCSGQTPCKASTQPPCHLECCNSTVASCLMLNGTLNVRSLATRGPQLNAELIASLLCLLAIIFLR